MKIIKEACVGSLSQAIQAEKNGADRIELCARLDLGGTTPSKKLIQDCLQALSIPIKVMIRPRGGNFVYNSEEINLMIKNIQLCKQLGIPEIVTGLLNEKNQVDLEGLSRLSANVGEMPITFHKAIDEVEDYKKSIADLKTIPQIQYLLTSGQKPTAQDGIENLKKMIESCGKNITVVVAGKVTDQNIDQLHLAINAQEYHGKLIVGNLD